MLACDRRGLSGLKGPARSSCLGQGEVAFVHVRRGGVQGVEVKTKPGEVATWTERRP